MYKLVVYKRKRKKIERKGKSKGPMGPNESVLLFEKKEKIFGDTLYLYIYNVFFCDIR